MRIEFEKMTGQSWQCVLNPAIAIDNYRHKWTISIGWLFWAVIIRFDKKQ